jgi:hypothetical protein
MGGYILLNADIYKNDTISTPSQSVKNIWGFQEQISLTTL